MADRTPLNEKLRKKDGVIDQRKQQIDPAGKHRVDHNEAYTKRSQKQPGQDMRDPQETVDSMPDGEQLAKKRHLQPGTYHNAQGDHAGSKHAAEEFDVKKPQKQVANPLEADQ
jgi:hypothetical protein